MLALILKDQKIFLLAINSLKQNLKHYSSGRGTFRLQSFVKIADFLEKKLLTLAQTVQTDFLMFCFARQLGKYSINFL